MLLNSIDNQITKLMADRYTPFTYQTIPILVEAYQYTTEVPDYTGMVPHWVAWAIAKSDIFFEGNQAHFHSESGNEPLNNGDWIVRFMNGDLKHYSNASFVSEFIKPRVNQNTIPKS